MIITAKFASTCPSCGRAISEGSKVEWSKGTKARHVTCPAYGIPASTPRPSTPRPTVPGVELAPYVRQEKWEPCKRSALPDTTGEVRVAGAFKRSWATLREGATGEPIREGDAVIVVGQTAVYESAEDNEDMGDMSGPGWHATLYLRRATAEEAAPALARAAEKKTRIDAQAARVGLEKELIRLCESAGWWSSDSEARRPTGTEIKLPGNRIAVLGEGAVAVWHGGYYDDYRASLFVTQDPRAVEIFGKLLNG